MYKAAAEGFAVCSQIADNILYCNYNTVTDESEKMSKIEKLIKRIESFPKDFTYQELKNIE